MRKKSFFVWSLVAALMTTACSDSDQNDGIQTGETGTYSFEVKFGEAPKSRAATSAVPVTSWAKSIDKVQFFLCSGNTVKYSAIADPTSVSTNPKAFTYTDVPVGSGYTLVAVANSTTNNSIVNTMPLPLGDTPWNGSNVREKSILDLTMKHKTTTFPAYTSSPSFVPTELTAFATPSEVFMAEYASPINVISGGPAATLSSPLELKREVALMRVRLNIVSPDASVDNVTNVDWTGNDVSVLIYNVPEKMGIAAGNAGGVSTTSVKRNVQIGATAFNMSNPAAADYSNPTTMISGNFKRWVDIPVFPNNGGRSATLVPGDAAKAPVAQRYNIVVTAKGKAGHILANNTVMGADASIYWQGQIQEAFFPNYIREVNLTLKTGGELGPLPKDPVEQGDLIITVSDPEPWNSTILTVDKEL